MYHNNNLGDEEKAVQEIIVEDTGPHQNSEDFQSVMDVIDSLNLVSKEDAEDGE